MANKSKIQSKTRWVRAIRAWKKSGLKASAFCRKNRLGVQSFYAWRRRLSVGNHAARPRAKKFLPVQVVTSLGENHIWMELALKNGRVLRLYREVAASTLAEMVQAVEAC